MRSSRHGNILAAVLPGGLAIIILQTYDWAVPARVWYLGIYIFLALCIFGRLNYLKSSRDWKQRRIFTSPEAGLDISVGVLISAAVLVLLRMDRATFIILISFRDSLLEWPGRALG